MAEKQKIQHGGSHYLGMAIQPRELAMHNQWDADAFSCLKYLSRFESKSGVEDLKKARHFAEMRRDFDPPALMIPAKVRITDYLVENGFDVKPNIKYALRALWDTVYMYDGVRLYSSHLIQRINILISTLDPDFVPE